MYYLSSIAGYYRNRVEQYYNRDGPYLLNDIYDRFRENMSYSYESSESESESESESDDLENSDSVETVRISRVWLFPRFGQIRPSDGDRYFCKVLDNFRSIYESIDTELEVRSDCRNSGCYCIRDIVAELQTANLRLADFRKKMISGTNQIVLPSDLSTSNSGLPGQSGHAVDCSVCFEKVEQVILDAERHCWDHVICKDCFLRNGKSICPLCRQSLTYSEHISEYLDQMTLIDKTVLDNEEWIEYLNNRIRRQ